MHLTFAFLFTTLALATHAQSVPTTMGGRSQGLANTTSVLADEWSLRNNPAGLAQVNRANIAFAMHRIPTLTGANRIAFVANSPVSFGVLSGGAFRFGDDLYNEELLSAGFAHALGLASLGFRIDYIQYRAEGFSTRSALGVTLGGLATLSTRISIGAYVSNINRPQLPNGERAPVSLAAGLLIKPNQHVLFTAEVAEFLGFDPTIKGAMEYGIKKKLFARTGFNLYPNAGFIGIGLHPWRLKIDYAVQHSWTLGLSHQVSLAVQLGKTKKTPQ